MSFNYYALIICSNWSTTAWFRLFVGDLSNDVSDDVLTNAFNKYASFTKARVIRDRLSQKVDTVSLTKMRSAYLNISGQVWIRRILRSGRLLESLERNGW